MRPRADVTAWMLDAIEQPEFTERAPFITVTISERLSQTAAPTWERSIRVFRRQRAQALVAREQFSSDLITTREHAPT